MRAFSGLVMASVILLAGCGDNASLPPEAGYGPNPTLPPPNREWPIPTVEIAKATGWAAGQKPIAAPGLKVEAFATGLTHPRWLYMLPNGDILVAESGAPADRPDNSRGIRRWVQRLLMGRAGAAGQNANRITLLRDSDANGTVDLKTTFLEGLYSPFGMAMLDGTFYVGNSNAVMTYLYTDGATTLKGPSRKLLDLPAGTINRHWTRNLLLSRDGDRLYVAVGSNSNIGEFGMNHEEGRAAIWEVDRLNGKYRIFASGLRNPNGMDWSPAGTLWTAVNERDEIGGDLVPDYMTSVRDGGFYGWPYSYYGQHVDERVQPQRPDLVAKAIKPDYALGAHTASLGLTFGLGNQLGPEYQSGVFIGQHGSWNRRPRHGYRVIFVPFNGGTPAGNGETPAGMPREVLTGFIGPDGEARGRPVGVIIDRTGALLVADDVGNTIWRITRQ